MKKNYLPMFLLVVLALSYFLFQGCGEQLSNPPGTVPEITKLLQEGWEAYENGDFTEAIEKFNKVIDINAAETEAYIGKGWSSLHTGNFIEGLGLFSFAISAEGKSPAVPQYDEVNNFDTTWTESVWVSPEPFDSVAYISPHHSPLLGMLDTIATWNYVYINIDTTTTPPGTTYTSVNYDTPIIRFDTYHFITKIPTDTVADSISLSYSYAYLDTSTVVTQFQKDAYAGESGIFKAQNDENNAAVSAQVVVIVDSSYSFSHDASATAENLHIVLARSYYNLKLFYNAVNEVLFLDPSWSYDPYSPQFLYELAKKIEELGG
jgi:tetratricopeptide (TPR) repeat protein